MSQDSTHQEHVGSAAGTDGFRGGILNTYTLIMACTSGPQQYELMREMATVVENIYRNYDADDIKAAATAAVEALTWLGTPPEKTEIVWKRHPFRANGYPK